MRILGNRTVRVATEERGAALLAAIGVTAVAAIIALVITSSTMYSLGYTTSVRSGVQSQAAAQAGIAVAAANLQSVVCQPTYSSTVAPKFSVAVSYSILDGTAPGYTDNLWIAGCPTSLLTQRVKFVSTGTASTSGVAGNSSGNTSTIEAIYKYKPSPPGTGAAIYSFLQGDSTMSNLTVTQGGSLPPSLQFLGLAPTARNTVNCLAGSRITGNVILGSGDVVISPSCVISGDLAANGQITIGGTVLGNVTSSAATSYSVVLSAGSKVGQNLYAAGPVSIAGQVNGTVSAGPTAGVSVVTSQGSVGGSFTTAGSVTGLVSPGPVIPGQLNMIVPTIPSVPPWVDYTYSSADWTSQTPAFSLTMLPSGSCTGPLFIAVMALVTSATTPQLLDATACGNAGLDFGQLGSTTTLNGNVAFVAKNFKFNNNDFESSPLPTADRQLWFIIPDTTDDSNPTCPTGNTMTFKSSFKIGDKVDSLIYSPCDITDAPSQWRGQIYASSTKFAPGFLLTYVPIGLPGVDFTRGKKGADALPGTGLLGLRLSLRNINVG